MNPKVIQVDFHLKRSVPPSPVTAIWTREERRAWLRVAQSPPAWRRFLVLMLTIGLHAAAILAARFLKPPAIIDPDAKAGGQGGAARVTFYERTKGLAQEEGLPEEQIYPNKPIDAPVITGPSTSAARTAQPATGPKVSVATKNRPRDFGATDRVAKVQVVPEAARRLQPPADATNDDQDDDPIRSTVEQPAEDTAPATDESIGFSKNLQDLLPNSMSEYVASQRRVGSIYGKGAVGGDIAPDAQEPVGFKAPDQEKVVVKRYDYAAYFMSLDRRFAEAWGGERFLPRGSSFTGSVGEFIEYDIVINRDGTLVKIINVSKQAQPNRDFTPVDRLVNEVFSHVFPMEPIPARIRETPLILRKRIQFTGYRYFMF
jgi:hypothetical protein